MCPASNRIGAPLHRGEPDCSRNSTGKGNGFRPNSQNCFRTAGINRTGGSSMKIGLWRTALPCICAGRWRYRCRFAKATAFICGLGYYELYINGRKVGDRVMDPLFTDYDKRVVYATYDVTDYFSTGSNAFGILLGNGWYSLPTRDVFGMHDANWHTPPKVRLNVVVEYESGARDVIVTDRTWKWGHGEIVYNSVRSGETIDHTKSVHGWNEPGFCR